MALAVFACAACGEDLNDAPNRRRHDDVCSNEVLATPIKRLARVYVTNAIAELLAPMADAPKAQLLADLRTRLDLVPIDDDERRYSRSDDRVTQDHVDAIVGLAMTLAARIADATTSYGTELLKVCGDAASRADLADDACLTKFIQRYGRSAFRRPLEDAEVQDFKAYYRNAVEKGLDGLAVVVARFVGHPRFYYRFDAGGERVEGAEGKDALYKLDRWELLAKLTFLFWAAPPTDALYDRAANLDVGDDAAVAGIVDAVLADRRAEQGVLSFFSEWLLLDKTPMPATGGNVLADKALVQTLGIDALPEAHRDDMIRDVLDLVRHYALTTDGTLDDVLTSRYSFARTKALSAVYGVEPWDGDPTHLVPLPENERSGLLSRAALVASSTEYTRPILKGKRVLTRVLCRPISPPPPGLDIKPIDLSETKTTRQATEEATAASACAGCHQALNGLGFATESYDPLGRFRRKEVRFAETTGDVLSQLDVRTQATILMSDGSARNVADAVALGAELAKSGDVHACLAQNYFEFVSGGQEDACAVTSLRESLSGPKGSIKSMLRASAVQRSFRYRRVQ
jgi:hypothetical protein